MLGSLFIGHAQDSNGSTAVTTKRSVTTRPKAVAKKGARTAAKPRAKGTSTAAKSKAMKKSKEAASSTAVHTPPRAVRRPRCRIDSLKYASDCSGIEAAVVALELLGCAPTSHLWASDKDPACRAMLAHNFEIAQVLALVDDEPSQLDQPDLYTSGFPCQPYSFQGNRNGSADVRSTPLWGVVQRIQRCLPKSFVLENVDALVSVRYKHVYDLLVSMLIGIQERNRRAYDLHVKVLNSQHHACPQHRPRVYFVGVLRSCKRCIFSWPSDLLETPPLDSILAAPGDELAGLVMPTSQTSLNGISRAYEKIIAQGGDPTTEPWVGNIGNSEKFGNQVMKDMIPCLTQSRGRQNGFWIFNRMRMMGIAELGRSQGFPTGRIQLPPAGSAQGMRNRKVTEHQLGGMYGNAFNVNTTMRILARLLPSIGIACDVRDPWSASSIPADCL